MSQEERSGKRDDRLLSARHRAWGFDAPFVDIDWWVVEYDTGRCAAIIDYKRWTAQWPPLVDANARALAGLYLDDGSQVPAFFVRYEPQTWTFHIRVLNEAAAERWVDDADRDMTEYEYVAWLHRLRGRVAPANVLTTRVGAPR